MTDVLMVILTAVYVIATIAICYFNYKSASATRAQLEEQKRQYNESKKPYVVAYLEVPARITVISIENIGKGFAHKVRVKIENSLLFSDVKTTEELNYRLTRIDGREFSLGVGSKWQLVLTVMHNLPNSGQLLVHIYVDETEQVFDLTPNQYDWAYTNIHLSGDRIVDIVNELKKLNEHLRKIDNAAGTSQGSSGKR
jgi:hypothetical protein